MTTLDVTQKEAVSADGANQVVQQVFAACFLRSAFKDFHSMLWRSIGFGGEIEYFEVFDAAMGDCDAITIAHRRPQRYFHMK